MNINLKYPRTGRLIKEDGSFVNEADILSNIYDTVKRAIKTTLQLNGNDVGVGNPLPVSATINATVQGEILVSAPVTRVLTLTETPIALNSKANLRQITIKNTHTSIRARIGELGMTPANRKGFALEPEAVFQESFDPTVAVTIYGRSEGAAIEVEVYEA